MVVCFVSPRQGAGKTTSCLNLGCALSRSGRRVLLMDCDPQASLSAVCGAEGGGLSRVLTDGEVLSECTAEAFGCSVLPAGELAGIEGLLLARKFPEKALRRVVGEAQDRDLVLLDCATGVGLLTINALAAADLAVVPVRSAGWEEDLLSLSSAVSFVRERLNPRLAVRALLTAYDPRALGAHASLEAFTALPPEKRFQTVIPRSGRLAELAQEGPAVALDPKCLGAKAYVSLAQELPAVRKKGG